MTRKIRGVKLKLVQRGVALTGKVVISEYNVLSALLGNVYVVSKTFAVIGKGLFIFLEAFTNSAKASILFGEGRTLWSQFGCNMAGHF